MNTHTLKKIVLGRAMRGLLEMQAECSGGLGGWASQFSHDLTS